MSVIVEDGTGVPGANSYASETYALAYADVRGLSLPSDLTLLSQYLVRATEFLDTKYAFDFLGSKVSVDQSREWPRFGVYVCNQLLSESEIPTVLRDATVQMAVAIGLGFDPTSGSEGVLGQVKKKEIGPIKITYTDGVEASSSDLSKTALGMLKTLIRKGSATVRFVRA